ncbi:MAG: GxxExxY protein [Gammaproteobacteria bacterium]|nr:GxxExxY protein [Gammaproteobacteria bacterium]
MSLEKVLSEVVINCGFEVSNRLGTGFLESVYENALCVELEKNNVFFCQQKQLKVIYKRRVVGNFIADIVVENKLLLELKTVSQLVSSHRAQVMNYLKATGLPVALLLNFGTPKSGVQRIVYQYNETEVI